MQITRVENLLKQKGARITRARSAILDAVFSHKTPLSAPKILKKLEKKGLKVNKTTVYRELSFLVKNNILQEVFIKPSIIHYESAFLPHHHHLICDNCGDVKEIKMNEKLLLGSVPKTDFTIKRHNLEFFGLCVNCD